jgi:hypothetical protein
MAAAAGAVRVAPRSVGDAAEARFKRRERRQAELVTPGRVRLALLLLRATHV